MGHTYTRSVTHVIFSTKERIGYLASDRREDVFSYMGGILRGVDCDPLHINGVADHVHMALRFPRKLALAAFRFRPPAKAGGYKTRRRFAALNL